MAKAALRIATPARRIVGPPEFFDEVEQGGVDWLKLRLGIPTASCFSMVMRDADAKTRKDYMYRLAGEILSGIPGEQGKIVTAAMVRGTEWEAEARERYEQDNFQNVERVGFVRRQLPSGRYVGCSPDGLMDKRKKGLEIKTMASHVLARHLDSGAASLPPEHRWQVHGTMWICELEEVHLRIYSKGYKMSPQYKVRRDETIIKEISNAVEVFDHEVNLVVQKARAMGA